MLELLAQGRETDQQWRHPLADGETVRLGREPQSGLSVPWDQHISREQADLIVEGDAVRVRCLESARNSAHFRDEVCREFVLGPGDEFRIGSTIFQLAKVGMLSDSGRLSSEFRRFLSETPSEIIRQLSPEEMSSRILERRTFDSTIMRKMAVVGESVVPAPAELVNEFDAFKAEIARLQAALGEMAAARAAEIPPEEPPAPTPVAERVSPTQAESAAASPPLPPDQQAQVEALKIVIASLENQFATEHAAQLATLAELKRQHAAEMAERKAELDALARQLVVQAEKLRRAEEDVTQRRLEAEALRGELARLKSAAVESAEAKPARSVSQARQKIEELASRLEEESLLRQAEEDSRERAEAEAAQYKAVAESLKGQVQKLRTPPES